LLACGLLASCWSGGGQPDDGWGTFDAGSDSDTDVDTDADSDSDGDTDNACPFDSAYPCSCAKSTSDCDDGSACVTNLAWDNGFCAADCSDGEAACEVDAGFGVEESCIWFIEDTDTPTHCGLVCQQGTTSGPCPPGQFCLLNGDGDYGICAPNGYEL
jgi:hypothetical protein